MDQGITAVVLAAGKGTRMKSGRAKVLHEVFFRPMLLWVLDAVKEAQVSRCAVVVGHQRDHVESVLDQYPVRTVVQEEQLGTGHAVLSAEQVCEDASEILILCGDTPLIQAETIKAMIAQHRERETAITLMSTVLEDPYGYGRIVSDAEGRVRRIVEEKDASAEERRIGEINAGIYLVGRDLLFDILRQVGTDNAQGEVYLTDIVSIANARGLSVGKFAHDRPIDILGVNSRIELATAHRELQMRRNRDLMLSGVTLYHPESIAVAPGCALGRDTTIEPGCQISGTSVLGEGCHVGPHAVISSCHIGDRAVIGAGAVLTSCSIERAEHIPPLTHRVG